MKAIGKRMLDFIKSEMLAKMKKQVDIENRS